MLPLSREDEQQFNVKSMSKANEMESYLIFDPTTTKPSPTVETASYPVSSSACKHLGFETKVKDPRNQRGKFEMLARLGSVLEATPAVRWLLADGAGSHEWFHRLLLGQTINLEAGLLEDLKFWSKLRFEDLPETEYDFGYRVVKIAESEDTFHYLCGPAHVQKNAAEQMRSALRTVTFGSKWTDMSASIDLGIWPAAYVGSDGMSDKIGALWMSPMSFVLDPHAAEVQIPWCLEGSFLMSLVCAHCQAAILHDSEDRRWRIETAMTGCLGGKKKGITRYLKKIKNQTIFYRIYMSIFACGSWNIFSKVFVFKCTGVVPKQDVRPLKRFNN